MKDEKPSAEQLNEEMLSQAREPKVLDGWFLPSQWRSSWPVSLRSGFPGFHWIRILARLWEARHPARKGPKDAAPTLADIVAKGKQHYYEGKSFRRWSLTMVHMYGTGVTAYLEDAWKLIGENAKIAQQRKQDTMIEAPFDKNETPKSATLYRMVAPGRFAPVPKETATAKLSKGRLGLLCRETIVIAAAVAFIAAGLFPPWLYTVHAQGAHTLSNAGYSFILKPPPPKEDYAPFGIQLDTSRLLIEWACILVFSGAAWFLCGVSCQRQDRNGPS
jgi:hypothetical protein